MGNCHISLNHSLPRYIIIHGLLSTLKAIFWSSIIVGGVERRRKEEEEEEEEEEVGGVLTMWSIMAVDYGNQGGSWCTVKRALA